MSPESGLRRIPTSSHLPGSLLSHHSSSSQNGTWYQPGSPLSGFCTRPHLSRWRKSRTWAVVVEPTHDVARTPLHARCAEGVRAGTSGAANFTSRDFDSLLSVFVPRICHLHKCQHCQFRFQLWKMMITAKRWRTVLGGVQMGG